MIPFRKSLAFRLLFISFILLALPLLVDSFIIIQTTYQDAIKDAKGYLVELAATREVPLSEMQPAKLPTLLLLESFLNLRKDFPEKKDPELDERLKQLSEAGNFYGIFLLKKTKEGRYMVVSSSNPSYEGKDYTDFIDIINPFSPDTYRLGYFSYLSYDSSSFQPFFLVGRAVYSAENEPLGLIIISANISDKLENFLVPDTDHYLVNFALLLPSVIVFASSDPSLQFQYFVPLDLQFIERFQKEIMFAGQELPSEPLTKSSIGYPFVEFTWKGKEQIGYINKLSTSTISILTYASKEAIFAQPFIGFIDAYSIYLAILVVGGTIAYFVTKRLAKPMFQLGHVMDSIKVGDLTRRYKVDIFGYEINDVGIIFNEMIETLLQKQQLAQKERIERETYAQELKIGQQVQRSLLVERLPEMPNIDLAERYIPAKEVGGDFFDVFLKEQEGRNILALAIADASGKGVRACFYSLGVRNMLRTYAKEFNDVAEVMARTNALFCDDTGDTGMFVTVFMAFFDPLKKELSYYSCGHNPAVLRKANGEITFLNHLGMAMGLEKKMDVEKKSMQLSQGDLVVFYTDGITEAHNEAFEMFSEKRLSDFLKDKGGGRASEIADGLLKEVKDFVGKAPQHDDITLLLLKVT